MYPIRTIMFPTDYSDSAAAAFDVACTLARDYRAELVIVHVALPPIPGVADGMVFEIPTGTAEQLVERLNSVRPTDPTIRVTHRVARGIPAREILKAANECHADLVVMGTHGRGGLSRLVLGSVAEEVLRSASCPVVTVRPVADAEKMRSNLSTAKAGVTA